MTSTPASPSAGESAVEKTYRTLWRWHFWAGVLVAPVLIWASVTGALFVFVDEIEPWLYGDMMFVEPRSVPVSLDEQMAAAGEYLGGDRAGSMSVSSEPDLATRFFHRASDEKLQIVYVNPYTAEVTGSRIFQEGFFDIVRQLHRNMFIGTPGRILMELATSWGIVLLLTGLYLWWPRRSGKARTAVKGVWIPRLNGGTRVVLRDLHALTGMYLSPIALILMGTGLFFSFVWGTGFLVTAQATNSLPEVFVDPPHTGPAEGREPLSAQQVLDAARERDPGIDPVGIDLPHDDEHGFHVSVGSAENPTERAVYVVDQYSGDVLTRTDMSNASAMIIARSFAYPLHVGSIFGLSTKILAFVTCLAIIVSTITGVWMWWRVRPRGKHGLPARHPDYRVHATLVALLLALGALLPVVGISFVIILMLDWILSKLNSRSRPQDAN